MLAVFGRADGRKNSDYFSEMPFHVNNCGTYRGFEEDLVISRPQGRRDYQLLFPMNGKMTVNECEVLPGEAYLLSPGMPQFYRYEKGEEREYYWIHFSGTAIADALAARKLREGLISLGSAKNECGRLLGLILRGFTEQYSCAEEYGALLLQAILELLGAPPKRSSPFRRAEQVLSDPQNEISVKELAESYGMTVNHFVRSFKDYMGVSPGAFRIAKRMDMACELLSATGLTVRKIAATVGYSDALYFSRAFKKEMGCSPIGWRRREGRS